MSSTLRSLPAAALSLAASSLASDARCQAMWTQGSSGAPQVIYAAMAHDPNAGKTVLFGGANASNPYLPDTWEFDGSYWTNLGPTTGMVGRVYAGMCYDSGRKKVLLVYGVKIGHAPGGDPAYDIWERSNGVWTLRSNVAFGFGWRMSMGIAYDAARARTIVFGGYTGQVVADTFSFDGNTWTKLFPAQSPPARYEPAMAYDERRQKIVMFGGTNASGYAVGDTWEWNGTTWQQMTPAQSPPARFQHSMVYDPARGKVVLFGGSSYPLVYLGDTWEWDGTSWTLMSPSASPSAREGQRMVYDVGRARTLLVGGVNGASDSWEYRVPVTVLGPGHTSGGLKLGYASQPVIGGQMTFSFPSAQGMAGLALAVGPELTPPVQINSPAAFCNAPGIIHAIPLLTLPAPGNPATTQLPIPNDPLLAGLQVVLQGFALQQAGCLLLTEGLGVVVQVP